MKLTEIKGNTLHYFLDSTGNRQGEFKMWYESGQLMINCHYKDAKLHGEYKGWRDNGQLHIHAFDINGEEIIDFLENPGEYPQTIGDRVLFKIMYGNAPFLYEL